MSADPTEQARKERINEINADSLEREALEDKYGQVWNTEEMTKDFSVSGFMAPYVVVHRKADGKRGTL